MRDIILITVESVRYDRRHIGDAFDAPTVKAITPGHYTRPALAATLSGQYRAAVETRTRSPTLAETLSDAGYATLGYSYSPQTGPQFGFDAGFDAYHTVDPPTGGPLARGSRWRERLGRSPLVRRLYHRVKPTAAARLFDAIEPDAAVVDAAIDAYRDADGPRFLWVHLLGSHRPYGRDPETAVDPAIDRRAANAGPAWYEPTVRDYEHREIVTAYKRAIKDVGTQVQRLRDAAASDAIVAVTSDHGEELGEAGYYFHGGYRRRVADGLVEVPLSVSGAEPPRQPMSLAALPAYLMVKAGKFPPDAWVHPGEPCLTVAPWADRASVRYASGRETLTFRDAGIGHVERVVGDAGVQEQLAALGYREER